MVYDPSAGDWPTVANLTKDLGPDGKFLKNAIELLNQTNDLATHMPFTQCNQKDVHVHLMDASIPKGTWRRLNKGILPVDSSSIQVSDTVGLYENRSECDLIVARKSGDVAAFRLRKDRRITEGINQDLATTMFYGDSPEKFFGLSPRYDVLGNPSDKPASNTFGMYHVLDAGGTSADVQSSIWLLGLGVDVGVFGIYPESAPNAGIEVNDLGEIDLRDADGKVFRGYATHYRVQQGLAIADWRYVVRIANVQLTAAMDEATINTFCDAMIDATSALPSLKGVRPVFFMSRPVYTRMLKMANRKVNMSLGFDDLFGVKHQLNISGCPIERCDAIVHTEAVLTA